MRQCLFEPCIPNRGTKVPDRPEWIHEIKHDGYRLIVQREDKRVRLFTRNGHEWSDRFPLIAEAALRNRNSSFVIDGEAPLLGVGGRSDFNGLHSTSTGPRGQWIHRRKRETLGLRIRTQRHSLIVFQLEHIVETATRPVARVPDDGDISPCKPGRRRRKGQVLTGALTKRQVMRA
jgi:hypothetical protein